MKRSIAIFSVLILIIVLPLAFVGCVGKNIDGVRISNKKFTTKVSLEQPTVGHTYYELVFSCTVKNTTKEDLQFTIQYIAKYGGLFSKEEREVQLIELKAGEKKTLEYVRKKTDNQIYGKQIVISYVEPLGTIREHGPHPAEH